MIFQAIHTIIFLMRESFGDFSGNSQFLQFPFGRRIVFGFHFISTWLLQPLQIVRPSLISQHYLKTICTNHSSLLPIDLEMLFRCIIKLLFVSSFRSANTNISAAPNKLDTYSMFQVIITISSTITATHTSVSSPHYLSDSHLIRSLNYSNY